MLNQIPTSIPYLLPTPLPYQSPNPVIYETPGPYPDLTLTPDTSVKYINQGTYDCNSKLSFELAIDRKLVLND